MFRDATLLTELLHPERPATECATVLDARTGIFATRLQCEAASALVADIAIPIAANVANAAKLATEGDGLFGVNIFSSFKGPRSLRWLKMCYHTNTAVKL